MLGKKLIVSAMGTGLLWAAGLAGHGLVAAHPGLMLLAGQVRLSLGDREGGLQWMRAAAQPDEPVQAPQAATVDTASARTSATPVHAVSTKCAISPRVSRAASNAPHTARVVTISQLLPADFSRQMGRREHRLAQLSLEHTRLGQQVRVMVQQRLRDLPQPPVPAEPMHANP